MALLSKPRRGVLRRRWGRKGRRWSAFISSCILGIGLWYAQRFVWQTE